MQLCVIVVNEKTFSYSRFTWLLRGTSSRSLSPVTTTASLDFTLYSAHKNSKWYGIEKNKAGLKKKLQIVLKLMSI